MMAVCFLDKQLYSSAPALLNLAFKHLITSIILCDGILHSPHPAAETGLARIGSAYIYIYMYVYACMYVCMYVCMYACMFVYASAGKGVTRTPTF